MVKFEQEELKGFKNFEPILLKNNEIKESISDLINSKDIRPYQPLFPPVCVITNEEYKICYCFKPKKATKNRATLEDIQELDGNIGAK